VRGKAVLAIEARRHSDETLRHSGFVLPSSF
jgi:hypothetical protein